MPKFLQFISRCLPFTISIESLRNVIKKGWTISEFQVWIGLLIPAIWTVSFIALSLYTIKKGDKCISIFPPRIYYLLVINL